MIKATNKMEKGVILLYLHTKMYKRDKKYTQHSSTIHEAVHYMWRKIRLTTSKYINNITEILY